MLIISLLKGIYEGIWRRWFGGGASGFFANRPDKNSWYAKLLKSRGTQTFANYIFLTICFYYSFDIADTIFNWFPQSYKEFINKYKLILSIYNAFMFQCLYWSKGHGPIFDFGHGLDPSSESLERYNGMWHTKYLNKFWDKYFGEETRYSYAYDCISMFIRYTYPCILVGITAGWYILPLGMVCTGCYAICWGLYDHDNWLLKKLEPVVSAPTQLAEIITGFTVGYWL